MKLLVWLAAVNAVAAACPHRLRQQIAGQPVTVESSIKYSLTRNIESVHSLCNADINSLCSSYSRRMATFGTIPSFVLVTSSNFVDTDKMMDEMLLDMMNFVTPSVVVSSSGSKGIIQNPREVVAKQVFLPSSSQLDGMESLDHLFDSVILSFFGAGKSLDTNMSAFGNAQVVNPAQNVVEVVAHPLLEVVAIKKDSDVAAVMPTNEVGVVTDNNNNEEHSNQAEVTASKKEEGLVVKDAATTSPVVEGEKLQTPSFSKISETLLSRKDVQDDPIKVRFARRLSEWDDYPMSHTPHGRRLLDASPSRPAVRSTSSSSAEFPKLFLPTHNPEDTEQCLWEHFKYHLVSPPCFSALDTARSTYQALKLQELENVRNEEIVLSQLYLCLTLAFGIMTMGFALFISLGKQRQVMNSKRMRDIMNVVYKDPLIKSKVEDALGKELGAIYSEKQPERSLCMGKFCIFLTTFSYLLLLVINPELVLLVGVPTLCCVGIYRCIRYYFVVRSHGRKRCTRSVTKNHGREIHNVYVAIPIV